jgi:hypothetical protein
MKKYRTDRPSSGAWLTVLAPLTGRAHKIHTAGATGIVTSNYSMGLRLLARVKPISDFSDMVKKLHWAQNASPSIAVIRGLPLPDVDLAKPVRRLVYERDGEGPYFRSDDVGNRVILIDSDDVPNPGFDLTTQGPEAARYLIREHLPSFLHQSSCWAQLSSSAGIRDDELLKFHLVYLSDQPVHDDVLFSFFYGNPAVDHRVFLPGQPCYVARPECRGFDDPLGTRRSFVLWGAKDEVSLPAEVHSAERRSSSPQPTNPAPGNRGIRARAELPEFDFTTRGWLTIEDALARIECAKVGNRHATVIKNARLIGGVVGAREAPGQVLDALLATVEQLFDGEADLQKEVESAEELFFGGVGAPLWWDE